MRSWIASLAIAALCGIVGLVAGGLVAGLAVDWYRISSFEGGSGYFVIGMALLAGLAATAVGLVVARVLAARPGMTHWTSAGVAVAAVLAIVAGVGGAARLLADIPPEIDGEALFLLVEVRFPPGLPVPAALEARPTVRLAALSGTSIRREVEGPLWLDDKRRDGESWVVPGMVEIFTARGGRLLSVLTSSGRGVGSRIDVPGHPDGRHERWSAWTPDHVTAAPAEERVSFRFRVVRRSAAARLQDVGPFRVETRVAQLYWEGAIPQMAAQALFTVRYKGGLVELPQTSALAVVRTSPVVLLARHASGCALIADAGGSAAVTPVDPCGSDPRVYPITSDVARFREARDVPPTPGWLDRRTFTGGGAFLLDGGVLVTDSLRFTAVSWPTSPSRLPGLPPLGLSPDGRSLAWFSPASPETAAQVAVTSLDTGATVMQPVDRTRQRLRTPELDVDPDWLAYYYEWHRGSEAADVLLARDSVVPRPFRGTVHAGADGSYQAYTLEPAGRRLQEAIRATLLAQGGTPRPDAYGSPQVRVAGVDYGLQLVERSASLSVFTFTGTRAGITRLADQLDRTLASGRLDALFEADPPRREP